MVHNYAPSAPGVAWRFGENTWDGVGLGGFTGSAVTTSGMYSASLESPGYGTDPVLQVASTATTPAAAVTSNVALRFTYNKAGQWKPTGLTVKAARASASTPRGYKLRVTRGGTYWDYAETVLASQRPSLQTNVFDLTAIGLGTGPVTIELFVYAPSVSAPVEFDEIEVLGDASTGPSVIKQNSLTGPAGVLVTTENSDDNGGDPATDFSPTPPQYNETSTGWYATGKGFAEYGGFDLNLAQGEEAVIYWETWRNTIPSVTLYYAALRSGGTNVLRPRVGSSGLIEVNNSTTGPSWTGTVAMPTGQWVLHGLRVKADSVAGEYEYKVWFDPANVAGTPDQSSGVVATPTANSLTSIRLGNNTASSPNRTEYRNFKVTTGWLGGGSSTQPPAVSAGLDIARAAGAPVDLRAVGYPAGGSYSWLPVAGESVTLSGAGTATPAFTAPSTGGYTTFRVTYTPPSGAPVTDDMVVSYLLPAGPEVIFTESRLHRIDARASSGTVTLLQIDGEGIPVDTSVAKVFDLDITGISIDAIFELTAKDGLGQESTQTIHVSPNGDGRVVYVTDSLVFDGDSWVMGGS